MNIFHIVVAIGILFSACLAEEKSSKRSQCGGTITSDLDTIEYPGVGEELIPGEVCVWTVHLNSTQNFRLNFYQFDVLSTSPDFDCSDAGVRIYSLTNLVPADRLENYTYCSDKQPVSNSIVSGNVMTVILYAGSVFPGTGIRLRFEGNNFDPFPKTNLATFTSTPSGLIGYPIGGNYPQSVLATWTVDVPSEYIDLNIVSIGLEDCTNPDPCTCDALIVFEISSKGVLSVRERLCSTSSNNVIQNTASRFVLGFFTDAFTQSGGGTGFQLQYFPSTEPPSTPAPNFNVPCGSVIHENETAIAYKESVQYGENERCIWTVRVNGASNYRLQVTSYGVTNLRDGLSMTGFNRLNFPNASEEVHVTSEGTYEVQGEIAIITFHTSSGASGFGFNAVVTALFYNPDEFYSINYIFTNPNPFKLKYPAVGSYHLRELSTFVYAPDSQGNTGVINQAYIIPTSLEACQDSVAVLLFSELSGNGGTWLFDNRICDDSNSYLVQSRDAILFVFSSDASVVRQGFTIEFGEQ